MGNPSGNHHPQAEAMLRDIDDEVKITRHLIGRDRLDPRVIEAITAVPRHQFVPPAVQGYAYDNRPLAIGDGQTISQPYIVALMTDLLQPGAGDTVLEVGTGSGYQAAVLSRLVKQVYSIEVIPALGHAAAERLRRLGYDNVEVRIGDGHLGWSEHAPYDAIIVTAAAGEVPEALISQLKPGGRMVIPVGSPYGSQELLLLEKHDNQHLSRRSILPVVFVPMTEGHETP